MPYRNYEETEPYEKGFGAYYAEKIVPHLDALFRSQSTTAKALKARKRPAVLMTIAITMGGTAAFLLTPIFLPELSFHEIRPNRVGSGLGALVASVWAWAKFPAIQYRKEAKQKVVSDTLIFFGFDHQRTEKSVFSEENLLMRTRMFPEIQADEIVLDDALSTVRNGHQVDVVEARLRFKSAIRVSPHVFTGLVIRVALNAGEFPDPIRILPKGLEVIGGDELFGTGRLDILSDWMAGDYEVWGPEASLAEDSLIRSAMSTVDSFLRARKFGKVRAAIYGQHVYLALAQSTDFFESLSSFRKSLSVNDVRRVVREAHIILDILDRAIDELGLPREDLSQTVRQ